MYKQLYIPRLCNGTPPHPDEFFGRPYGGRIGTVRRKTRLDNTTKTGCCKLKDSWTTALPNNNI